jgi:hypothetical protein
MHLKNVTDGTSKTIAFVEADPAQAVEWTKPDDLEFNAADPKAGLGNVRPGGWQAAFCDGSVQFIADAIDPQLIAALFTRAGGEPADLNAAAPIPFGPPPPRPAGGPDLVPVEPLER